MFHSQSTLTCTALCLRDALMQAWSMSCKGAYDFKLQPQPKITLVKNWTGKAVGISSIVMRLGDTAWITAVNEQLKIMRANGKLKAILLKYGMPETAYITCDAPTSFTTDGIAQCLG